MKKVSISILAIIFCVLLTTGVSAEEARATGVIVDTNNNTLQFIYENEENEIQNTFADIPDDAWYTMFVSYLKQLGIVDGITASEYAPNQAITRSEFVKMISLLSNDVIDTHTATLSFSDSSTSNWYHAYAEWAAENHIAEGDNYGNFNGTTNITREEAVTILYRFSDRDAAHVFDDNLIRSEIVFSDENEISDWARDAITAFTKAGVIQGYENSFLPKSNITRAEAAKILAVYDIFNRRPTLLSNYSEPVEYLNIEPVSGNEKADSSDIGISYDITPIGEIPLSELVENTQSGITPSWKTANHADMLDQSFRILGNDNRLRNTPVFVTNLITSDGAISSNGKLSTTARSYIRTGSKDPDTYETDYSFGYHYYKYSSDLQNGVGTTKSGCGTTTTAYHMFNNHYYNAKCNYAAANYKTAYNELGRSIHYLQDINSPYHAMLVGGDSHYAYEAWVRDHFYSEYWASSASDSYSFVCNSSFKFMSNSFSKAACEKYYACSYFNSNPSSARSATAELTKRSQRAVSGLLYRYLVDTGRAN